MVAQIEAPPAYKFVSVSGPVVEARPADWETESKPTALRFFVDQALADMYSEATKDEPTNDYLMRPEKWLTLDYSKMSQAG